jgi:hypothetical protein
MSVSCPRRSPMVRGMTSPASALPAVFETAAQWAVARTLAAFPRTSHSEHFVFEYSLDPATRTQAEVRTALDALIDQGIARRTGRGRYRLAVSPDAARAIPLDPETYAFRVVVETPDADLNYDGTGNYIWRARLSRDEARGAVELERRTGSTGSGRITAIQVEHITKDGDRIPLRRWQLNDYHEVPLPQPKGIDVAF